MGVGLRRSLIIDLVDVKPKRINNLYKKYKIVRIMGKMMRDYINPGRSGALVLNQIYLGLRIIRRIMFKGGI